MRGHVHLQYSSRYYWFILLRRHGQSCPGDAHSLGRRILVVCCPYRFHRRRRDLYATSPSSDLSSGLRESISLLVGTDQLLHAYWPTNTMNTATGSWSGSLWSRGADPQLCILLDCATDDFPRCRKSRRQSCIRFCRIGRTGHYRSVLLLPRGEWKHSRRWHTRHMSSYELT
jgi:hypothetical protein